MIVGASETLYIACTSSHFLTGSFVRPRKQAEGYIKFWIPPEGGEPTPIRVRNVCSFVQNLKDVSSSLLPLVACNSLAMYDPTLRDPWPLALLGPGCRTLSNVVSCDTATWTDAFMEPPTLLLSGLSSFRMQAPEEKADPDLLQTPQASVALTSQQHLRVPVVA